MAAKDYGYLLVFKSKTVNFCAHEVDLWIFLNLKKVQTKKDYIHYQLLHEIFLSESKTHDIN